MMRVIDAHQHFWLLATPGHEWPTVEETVINRDFGPIDLQAAASDGMHLAASVLVQSQPTDTDTDWILALAASEPNVAAVVGWVDLEAPEAVDRIRRLASAPKLRSVRPMLQSIEDTDWLLRADLAPAIEAMIDYGLRLDALIQPRHLPMLVRFVQRWPALPIVINHAAKPFAARLELDPWREDIAALADLGLWCKLSGLRTEQAVGQPAAALQCYVDHLLQCFGTRLMWGSDWPVLILSGDSYRNWYEQASRLTGLSGERRMRLFVGAAIEFYGLGGIDV